MRSWWIVGLAAAVAGWATYPSGRATAEVTPRRSDVRPVPPLPGPRRVQQFGLPLVFEKNSGQAPEAYDFLVRCEGYHAFVAPTEVVFSFDGCGLTMAIDGATGREPETAGLELPGKSNYLLGNDPSKWVTNVSQFRGARYSDVVRGTSWSFGGNGRVFEFAFDLAPGAESPKLGLDGQRVVKLTADGTLRIEMPHGVATFSAPVAWQDMDGYERRVAAAWSVETDGAVRVALGTHDPALAVHVDPTVAYETYLGGNNDDAASAVSLDDSGGVYVAGSTRSVTFPVSASAYDMTLTGTGDSDAFVTKFSAAGTSLVFSTYLGGGASDRITGLAVDASGLPYVCGPTVSSDFPVTSGAYNSTLTMAGQNFVAILGGDGQSLQASTFLNNVPNVLYHISIGANGVAHVSDETTSVITLYPALSAIVWQTRITPTTQQGTEVSLIKGTCTDAAGNVYVCGYTSSASWVTTAGAFDRTRSGTDAFLVKLSSSGAVVFSTLLGGAGSDFAFAVAVNASGQPYVAGHSSYAPDFPVTADAYFKQEFAGAAFLTRFNSTGSDIWYSTCFGADSSDSIFGVAAHRTGSCVVVGNSGGASAFPLLGAWQTSFGGGSSDGFAAKFERDGTLAWSSFIGGSATDEIRSVGMAPNGTIAAGGFTTSVDAPTVVPYQSSNHGTANAFVIGVPDNLSTATVAAPVINPEAPAEWTVGIPYASQLTASAGSPPLRWTITGGVLPSGLSMSRSGRISGTASSIGLSSFTVHVDDSAGFPCASDAQFALRINAVPMFTAGSLQAWTATTAFDQSLPLVGGTGVPTVTLESGALPEGITLGDGARAIGTPAAPGDFAFVLRASDVAGATTTRAFVWKINPSLEIGAATLPEWTEKMPFLNVFTATGGTGVTSWSTIAGLLPVDRPIDAPTGTVAGSVSGEGDYEFTLRVTDAIGSVRDRAFSMHVNPTPSLSAQVLPVAFADRPYSVKFDVTGGTLPVTWSLGDPVSGPSLPPGLVLVTDRIVGTPAGADYGLAVLLCTDARGAVARRVFTVDVAGALDLSHRNDASRISLAADTTDSLQRYLEVLEGTTLTASLKLKGRGIFNADLVLIGPDGSMIDVNAFKKVTPKSVQLTKVPIGATGRYVLSIQRAPDSDGQATLGVSIAPRAKWPGGGAVTPGGSPGEFTFAAPPGASATIVAKSAKGSAARPHIVSVLDDDGIDVATGATSKEKGKSASLKLVTQLAGGRYRVLFAARDSNAGDLTWSVALKLPKTYDFALPELGAGDGR